MRFPRAAGGHWLRCFSVVWLVVCSVFCVCDVWAAAAPVMSLRDDRGREQVFDGPPQRIVSLLPSLTESICALGGCAKLVGTDRYSSWPVSVNALPKLGGLEDTQIERIVALRPDVVLTAPSSRVIDKLESLGLRVLVLEPQTHADVQRSLQLLATMLGTPSAAAPLWAGIERDVVLAAARVPAAVRGQRVYFEIDGTPYAAGAGSFIGQTLGRLAMANAVPASLGPFPKLNPEFVVRAQPDVVMATAASLTEMPRRPGWSSLRALRESRVCGFQPAQYDLLVRPGPRLGEAALALADCLVAIHSHP